MTDATPSPSLSDLLTAMRPDDGETSISVGDVINRIGDRSFSAAILVPALLLVSPLSGIPGSPTMGMLIILIVTVQAVMGRQHLWLPRLLMHRRIAARNMHRALDFLDKPVGWVERHSHGRLHLLTHPPLHLLAYLAILVVVLPWPVLELLPFVTSFGAGAVSLMSVGLITRDGAYLVAGYILGGALLFTQVSILMGLV